MPHEVIYEQTSVLFMILGINALTISCRCATVPEGVSPACHLGDGSSDLVLVYAASRLDYLRHLIRIKAKNSSQVCMGTLAAYSRKKLS